jgi:hypothetical protein
VSKMEKMTCPYCETVQPVLVPKGGDGSGVVFRKHYRLKRIISSRNHPATKTLCEGSRQLAN